MQKPTAHWSTTSRFYHIYPLGACGAPYQLEHAQPHHRLSQLYDWVDHLESLCINALWLGPLFVSSSHGYDTRDYFHVDPRLGSNQDLRNLVDHLHSRGIRVVLDAVFNHVGRDFWAFRDLRQNLQHSAYRSWFQRLSFSKGNRLGDPFYYQSWKGHRSLVKLKLTEPEVKKHLFAALKFWIEDLHIDGLRLDAADCINLKFMAQLSRYCHKLKPDFWLLGELVSGDYRHWIEKGKIDSVTNYELYDGLHRAHGKEDYRLLAGILQRQFGPQGKYRGLRLYHFVDNHDVTRIATLLKRPGLLYPLHILLYTLPGIPSVYYGSEWGERGSKYRHSDAALRPAIPHPFFWHKAQPDLLKTIGKLAHIHQGSQALQFGSWSLLYHHPETLVYLRHCAQESLVIVVHRGSSTQGLKVQVPWQHGILIDLLGSGETFLIYHGQIALTVHPYWGRILRWQP